VTSRLGTGKWQTSFYSAGDFKPLLVERGAHWNIMSFAFSRQNFSAQPLHPPPPLQINKLRPLQGYRFIGYSKFPYSQGQQSEVLTDSKEQASR
jgi:hypothetical protein